TSISAVTPIAVAAITAVPPAAAALVRALGDVRQQCHLTRPLDRLGDLHLVPAARAGDAAAADLAFLGDVAPELVDVLVVDLRDLVLAEEAVAPPDLALRAAGPSPLLLLGLLSRHRAPRTGCRRRSPPGSRRSPAAPLPARTDCRRPRRRRRHGCRGTGRSRRRSRRPRACRRRPSSPTTASRGAHRSPPGGPWTGTGRCSPPGCRRRRR